MARGIRAHRWKNVAFANDISSEAKDDILSKFAEGLITTEQLQSPDKHPRFAIRLDKKTRVICTTKKIEQKDCLIVLNVDLKHNYSRNKTLNKGAADKALAKLSLDSVDDSQSPDLSSYSINTMGQEIRAASYADGRVLVYSQEQAAAIDSFPTISSDTNSAEPQIATYVINGLPGSGKTSVVEQILTNSREEEGTEAMYITKSPSLVKATKAILEAHYDSNSPLSLITDSAI